VQLQISIELEILLLLCPMCYRYTIESKLYASFKIDKRLRPFYKSKLELKSNLSEIFPVNCKFISIHIFIFVLKVKLKDLKFEFCQYKLE